MFSVKSIRQNKDFNRKFKCSDTMIHDLQFKKTSSYVFFGQLRRQNWDTCAQFFYGSFLYILVRVNSSYTQSLKPVGTVWKMTFWGRYTYVPLRSSFQQTLGQTPIIKDTSQSKTLFLYRNTWVKKWPSTVQYVLNARSRRALARTMPRIWQ